MDVSIIATLYSYEPVIASVTKFGANYLYLLVDSNPDETQNQAIKRVKELLSKYVSIRVIKTDVYDILNIAKDSVKLIDKVKNDSKVLLNISAARKPKSLGLLFAGYSRAKDIEKIFYITKEDKKVIVLPKISFNLNSSQRKVLKYLNKEPRHDTIKELYYALNMSKSMFYKTMGELRSMGLVETTDITDSGRIALL